MQSIITKIKEGNFEDAVNDRHDGFYLPSFEELEKAIKNARAIVPQQKELLTSDLIEGTDLVKGLISYSHRILMFKEVQLNKKDRFSYVLIKIIE